MKGELVFLRLLFRRVMADSKAIANAVAVMGAVMMVVFFVTHLWLDDGARLWALVFMGLGGIIPPLMYYSKLRDGYCRRCERLDARVKIRSEMQRNGNTHNWYRCIHCGKETLRIIRPSSGGGGDGGE